MIDMTTLYFCMLFLCCVASYGQENKSSEKEVWTVIQNWNEAFAANAVDSYFNFIHDDLTLIVPSSPYRIESKKLDRAEFIWSLNNGVSKVQFFQELDPEIQIFGNTAIVSYYTRGVYGELKLEMTYLKETDVLVKESGKWKIIHIHVSD
jgi:ketosteroid isomerase-like protein